MAGIAGFAVHVPRPRVAADAYKRALGRCAARIEAKRTLDHDEDETTMAIAAARALRGVLDAPPAALFTASATAGPFAALLAEALGLHEARAAEHRGPCAGLEALLAARDAVAQGAPAALVVSSDAPAYGPEDDREHGAGAGAVAMLLTPKGPAQLRRAAHASAATLDGGAEEALRGALAALTRSGLRADSVQRAATRDLEKPLADVVARALPKARLAAASAQVGDAGATAPLLGLALALEEAAPGEVVVAAAAGEGRAQALSVEAEGPVRARGLRAALAAPAQDLDHPGLARLRGWTGPSPPDVSQGAAVSAAQWQESLPARLRFQGQRCAACGEAQFPPRGACLRCGAARMEPLALTGKGLVFSLTTIGRGSAPSEFAEQQRRAGAYDVAIVALEEGPRVAAQVCDASPGQLRIGAPVHLVVRRLYTQDGRPRYGFKAAPA